MGQRQRSSQNALHPPSNDSLRLRTPPPGGRSRSHPATKETYLCNNNGFPSPRPSPRGISRRMAENVSRGKKGKKAEQTPPPQAEGLTPLGDRRIALDRQSLPGGNPTALTWCADGWQLRSTSPSTRSPHSTSGSNRQTSVKGNLTAATAMDADANMLLVFKEESPKRQEP